MRLNISHKFIKVEGEDRIDVSTDKTIINPEIDCTAKIEILPIEAEETMIKAIDQIIEIDQEIIIDKTIGETFTGEMIGKIITDMMIGDTITDKTTEGTTREVTIDKIMDMIIIETMGIGIEVQVGTTAEVVIEIIQGKDLNEIEMLAEIEVEKDSPDHNLDQNQKIEEIVIGQDQSQGLDPAQE